MFTFFCNKCFRPSTVENSNKFYLNKCGHVHCQRCMSRKRCYICKAPFFDVRTIDANMTNSVGDYFESPVNAFRRFQKIVKFQAMQDALYAHNCVDYLPREIKAAAKKLNGMMRIDTSFEEKIAHESKRIEKLKDYLTYKRHRAQELHQRHQRPARGRSSTGSPYSRVCSPNTRPTTPTISTLSDVSMSSTNCTSLSNQSDLFLHHVRNDFSL